MTGSMRAGLDTPKNMSKGRDIVVALRGITKKFGHFVAVDELSLEVPRGELLCLLGPSGCGKTTSLRMIAGLIDPSSGSIQIEGREVAHLPPYRRDTGMVFQNYALFPHMTVAQNIAFGLDNMGIKKSERQGRVEEMLHVVELDEMGARYPRELSGGQQQRVALSRALAMRPAVLLLDEPFSNLDARLRVRLRDELKKIIKSFDTTTLFVTHDQEEALMLSDRIVVMNQGRVEQIGAPEVIYEQPESQFVAEFIGLCNLFEGVVQGGVFQSKRGLTVQVPNWPDGVGALLIRPEYVRPGTGGSTLNHFRSTVQAVSYFGSTTLVELAVDEEKLTMAAHFPIGDHPRVEQVLPVEMDPGGLRFIPST